MAYGAETEDEDTIIEAEENGWIKAEWWKLLLRPSHLPIIQDLDLPPLPPNVTVDDVFAHHLRYVKDQVKTYITTTYGEGGSIWDILSPTANFILCTPNGWEGSQQRKMRLAAIRGGLVDEAGGRRVKFVTEAEAAVLYAAESGAVNDWLVDDGQLILCDCGGGTVDITGYKIACGALNGRSRSQCKRIVSHFDKNAKKKFSDEGAVSYVQLDGHKSNPNLNITRGRLKITGPEMASFFAGPLQKIIEGLEIAFENGDRLADKVILVGGLASSPYIYSKLLQWGKDMGISVSRPDGPTVKAVANGALAWHLDSSVDSRVAKCHYGLQVRRPYDENNPDCIERAATKYKAAGGKWYITQGWASINEKLEVGKEFISSFWTEMSERTSGFEHPVKLYVYRRSTPPPFITFPGKATLQPGFEIICEITGNLEKCYEATPFTVSDTGARYKMVAFQVCLALGETELTARLRWKEDDVDIYGPATIAYE
ncbi:hypothetical protein DFH09DRAFT_1338454 [Mycena vulgaris]|nr:hypothetical protein DFH09DRAFT_1338454 [Mycena vulgaris]